MEEKLSDKVPMKKPSQEVCGAFHQLCREPGSYSYCEHEKGHEEAHRCRSCEREFPGYPV